MSNFQFLKPEWPGLYQKMQQAEQRVYTEPVSSARYSRLALEESVHHIYELEYLEKPYNISLASLISQEEFLALVPYTHKRGINITRKTGNKTYVEA